tara:strand:- start:2693 stop:3826 length:1134 start_codon:yes stop_codon:yes gene_type:complete
MFLSKRTPLVAVDLGSHSIKVVQLKETMGRNFELVNIGIMPLEEGSIVGGFIKEPDQVSKALSRLIKAEKIKTNFVVASVSGGDVFIKKIKIPQISEKQLSERITEEAERHIPFAINEVALDFQVLDPVSDNIIHEKLDKQIDSYEENPAIESEYSDEHLLEVLLVAVHREIINERTEVLLQAGLKPAIIDLDVFALMNAASLTNDLSAMGSIALIDLGDSFTHLNILKNGSICYAEDIPLGGRYYSTKLMSEYRIPFKQTHKIKGGHLPEGIKKEEALALIVQGYKNILEEIHKSFEKFSTISNSKVERILLSGGGCLIHGIDDFIGNFFKIPVEFLNPMQGVKINSKIFDQEVITALAGLSTVAIGLATRRFAHS